MNRVFPSWLIITLVRCSFFMLLFVRPIRSMFGTFVLFHILIYWGKSAEKTKTFTKILRINSHNKNIPFFYFVDSIAVQTACIAAITFFLVMFQCEREQRSLNTEDHFSELKMPEKWRWSLQYRKMCDIESDKDASKYRKYAKWLNCSTHITLTAWLGENLLNYYVNEIIRNTHHADGWQCKMPMCASRLGVATQRIASRINAKAS